MTGNMTRNKREYRFGLKSGQGFYIIADTVEEAMKDFCETYFYRYLKSDSHKRMTKVDRMYAKERLEDIRLWKLWDSDGQMTMPKTKLEIP